MRLRDEPRIARGLLGGRAGKTLEGKESERGGEGLAPRLGLINKIEIYIYKSPAKKAKKQTNKQTNKRALKILPSIVCLLFLLITEIRRWSFPRIPSRPRYTCLSEI